MMSVRIIMNECNDKHSNGFTRASVGRNKVGCDGNQCSAINLTSESRATLSA